MAWEVGGFIIRVLVISGIRVRPFPDAIKLRMKSGLGLGPVSREIFPGGGVKTGDDCGGEQGSDHGGK